MKIDYLTTLLPRLGLSCLIGCITAMSSATGTAPEAVEAAAVYSTSWDFSTDRELCPAEVSSLMAAADSRVLPGGLRLKTEPTEGFTYGVDPVNNYAAVVNYQGTASDAVIADEVTYEGKTYPVTKILSQAFVGKSFRTLTFGRNIREVQSLAFAMCQQLFDVKMNEGLETLADQCFYMMCSQVTSLDLPSSLKTIGEQAFKGTKLSGELLLPKSLETIGAGAFMGNPITGFYFADDNSFFSSKDGILFSKDGKRLVCMPPGLVEENTTVPEGVVGIDAFAFFGNTALKSVVLPQSLESIGERAFANCNLQSFDIGPNVKSIEGGVVMGNKNLKTLTLDAANKTFSMTNGMLVNPSTGDLVMIPYMSGALTVPGGVKAILPYLAYGNAGITSLEMGASVQSIGTYAFYQCKGLTSVLCPGIKEIGHFAFYQASALKSITFPNTLEAIGNSAFAECDGIMEVILPKSLRSLGRTVFHSCAGIKKVVIPGSIQSFGEAIFYQCMALEEAELGEGLTAIPDQLFNWDAGLKKLNFPSTLKTIGLAALYNCQISEINLPEGFRKIGRSGIYGTAVKNLVLPNSLDTIEDFGLGWNNEMVSLKTGSGLRYAGAYAFQVARKLEKIELNEGLTYLGVKACASLGVLKKIELPSTLTYLGDSCFIKTRLDSLVNRAVAPQPLPDNIAITGDPYDNPPYEDYATLVIAVPQQSVTAYEQAPVWKRYKNIIPISSSGIDEIPTGENINIRIIGIYGPDGSRRSSLQPGVNICRRLDGSIEKRLISSSLDN